MDAQGTERILKISQRLGYDILHAKKKKKKMTEITKTVTVKQLPLSITLSRSRQCKWFVICG